MVEMLFQNGADPNSQTKSKDTCLHLAVVRSDYHMASKLLSLGRTPQEVLNGTGESVTRVATENSSGDSPLHTACCVGDMGLIQLLCKHKAVIEFKNSNDETPLHWAASAGMPSVVRFLIQRGAHANLRSKTGKTPLDLAPDDETRHALTTS